MAGTTYDLIFSFSAAVEIDTIAIFNIGASAATVSVAYSSDDLSPTPTRTFADIRNSTRWQVDPCHGSSCS